VSDAKRRAIELKARKGDPEATKALAAEEERATGVRPTLPEKDPDDAIWESRTIDEGSALDNGSILVPRIGIGASHGYGSDSYPYTVIAVSESGHTIKLRHDEYRVISGSFQTNDAKVEYYAGSDDSLVTATRRGFREDGTPIYCAKGSGKRGARYAFGFRRYHQDPHF
jgi:hypothetical protein